MELKELRKMRDIIIEQYKNGKTFEDLMNIYSSTWGNIYDVVATSFEHTYFNITEAQKIKIIEMYKNNSLSTTKIGEQLKIYHKLVAKVLQENGIERINNGKRTYKLNEHYFDNIDTQNKAYILGFFYADGCNIKNKSTISMSLEEKDKEILEKIRLEIGSEKELEFINQSKRKDKDNDYHYKDMWRLLLFSTHMCNTLESYGMIPNKSLQLKFPEWLDESLYSHFIRGYFDGDGSICIHKTKNNGYRYVLSITSTNDFCKRCLEILREKLNIGGGIYDASSHNGITKVLSISGSVQLEKVLNWLYKDADLYMKRKYDKFINQFMNAKYINNSQSA